MVVAVGWLPTAPFEFGTGIVIVVVVSFRLRQMEVPVIIYKLITIYNIQL